MSTDNMKALHTLDGEIDIRCREYVGNACDEIATVRSDSTNYMYKEIIKKTFIILEEQLRAPK